MRKKNKRSRRPSVRRERESIPWKRCILTVFCGLLLAAGFFTAARQHFQTMDFGMRNAKLRNQLEDLRSENRRLTLRREMAMAPAQIKKAAVKIGFKSTTFKNIEIVAPAPSVSEVPGPELAAVVDDVEKEGRPDLITRTVSTGSTTDQSAKAALRPTVEKSGKFEKAVARK